MEEQLWSRNKYRYSHHPIRHCRLVVLASLVGGQGRETLSRVIYKTHQMDEGGPDIRGIKQISEIRNKNWRAWKGKRRPLNLTRMKLNPSSQVSTKGFASGAVHGLRARQDTSDCGCTAYVAPSPAQPPEGAEALQVLVSHLSQLAAVRPRQGARLSLPYASTPVLPRALILAHQCHSESGRRSMEVWKMQETVTVPSLLAQPGKINLNSFTPSILNSSLSSWENRLWSKLFFFPFLLHPFQMSSKLRPALKG